MSRDDYIKEGIRQLSDANFYVKLDHDPTPNHIDEIHNTLLKALQRDEITQKRFSSFSFLPTVPHQHGIFYRKHTRKK